MPVAPALPVAFLFARRRRPVLVLALPPRPYPRRLPAMRAAIALPRVSRTKAPLASFEQTPPGTGPSRRPFPSAGLLIFGMACRTLGKAHGRSLLPEAPALEGNRNPLQGAADLPVSTKPTTLSQRSDARGLAVSLFSASGGAGRSKWRLHRPATGRLWSGGRSYNDLARRNGSRHCRDATIAEG